MNTTSLSRNNWFGFMILAVIGCSLVWLSLARGATGSTAKTEYLELFFRGEERNGESSMVVAVCGPKEQHTFDSMTEAAKELGLKAPRKIEDDNWDTTDFLNHYAQQGWELHSFTDVLMPIAEFALFDGSGSGHTVGEVNQIKFILRRAK